MDERSEILALHIENGMHEGGCARIHENVKYRIGADFDGDIVLRDEGIAPCHVALEFSEGLVRLESFEQSVLIDGLRKLPPGHIAESRLPCRFSLGTVQLRLDKDLDGDLLTPPTINQRSRQWLHRFQAHSGLLVLGFLLLLASYLLLPDLGATKNAQAHTAADTANERPAPPPPKEVREALQAQLTSAGLHSMEIRVEGKLVEVRGTLPAHLKPQWLAVQEGFDRRYGTHYVLRSALADMETPRIAITSVWLGKQPYIVDADGDRHYQGAILKEGWLLQSIDPGRIVLARNGLEHVFGL